MACSAAGRAALQSFVQRRGTALLTRPQALRQALAHKVGVGGSAAAAGPPTAAAPHRPCRPPGPRHPPGCTRRCVPWRRRAARRQRRGRQPPQRLRSPLSTPSWAACARRWLRQTAGAASRPSSCPLRTRTWWVLGGGRSRVWVLASWAAGAVGHSSQTCPAPSPLTRPRRASTLPSATRVAPTSPALTAPPAPPWSAPTWRRSGPTAATFCSPSSSWAPTGCSCDTARPACPRCAAWGRVAPVPLGLQGVARRHCAAATPPPHAPRCATAGARVAGRHAAGGGACGH